MCNLCKVCIREETDEDCHWEREGSEDKADSPLYAINRCNAEGTATNKDDCYLGADHDTVDTDEEEIALKTFEDVEFVVETTVVELVEDLHPDESVEDHGIELELLSRVGDIVAEDLLACKVENEGHDQLEDGLADDHFPHVHCNQRSLLSFGPTVEDLGGWGISGKSEGCKSVHDKVDPQKLDGCEDGVHVWVRDSRDEREQDGGDVNGDLELVYISCVQKWEG